MADLSRRRFLAAATTAVAGGLLGPLPQLALAAGTARKLILIYADGGWDTTYTFDPKLDQPDIEGPERHLDPDNPDDVEFVEHHGDTPIVANPLKRPHVSAYFERWGDRTCVVNGIWIGNIAHNECRYRMLTGTALNVNPDLGVIAGAVHGDTLPLGHVDLSGFSLAGPLGASTGRVGDRSQIKTLIDPTSAFPSTRGLTFPQFVPDPTDEQAARAFLESRAERLRALRGGVLNDRRIDDLLESLDRASRVKAEGRELAEQLTLGEEPSFDAEMDIAVELLDRDICHAVMVEASGTQDVWDTHDDNFPQHALFDGTFDKLSQLLDLLESRGLLDETLVLVVSEMGRTPRYNEGGGKDHWGHTTALLIGGGVAGGRTLGGTDALLESLPVDLATGEIDPGGALNKYDNFVAGLLELLDVDPEPWLPGVTPFRGMAG